jgi:hypothetical protein
MSLNAWRRDLDRRVGLAAVDKGYIAVLAASALKSARTHRCVCRRGRNGVLGTLAPLPLFEDGNLRTFPDFHPPTGTAGEVREY